jgi:hypothetical protein
MSVNFSFGTSLFNIGVPGGDWGGFNVKNPFASDTVFEDDPLIYGVQLMFSFKPGFKPGMEE